MGQQGRRNRLGGDRQLDLVARDVAGDPPVELLPHPRDLEGQRVRGRVFGIDGRATRVGLRRGVYDVHQRVGVAQVVEESISFAFSSVGARHESSHVLEEHGQQPPALRVAAVW